ncbi:MAG: HIT family protein [Candidatus Roizmanbacteria bacterium]
MNTQDQNCSFCDKTTIKNQQIIDNNWAIALEPRRPVTSGHMLIIPKRHVSFITDLSSHELMAMQELISQLSKIFVIFSNAQGYHVMNNNGELADQHIPHVHFHVFFRSKDDISPFDILSKKFPRESFSEDTWNKNVEKLREISLSLS